jgi:hypothetical protein
MTPFLWYLLGVLFASLVWGTVVLWLLRRQRAHVQTALNLPAASSRATLQTAMAAKHGPRGPVR